jgi:hypothetical protein
MYIASLIDYINTDFDYTFRSDENIGLEYSYFVEAIIQVTDSNGTKIYEKKENLIDKKKFADIDNNTFKVNESLKVDYAKYNKIAKNFIDEYGITAESKLIINLCVDVQGKHADFEQKLSKYLNVPYAIALPNCTLSIYTALWYWFVWNSHDVFGECKYFLVAVASIFYVFGQYCLLRNVA